MSELRYDGRVVIVTGAGGGLGRTYALMFGSRGASVVVNDLGGSATGDGASSKPADLVVNEIKRLGGKAVANYDSVEFGEKIVQTAIDNFGRVDIVVNNAGILRDVSFARMKDSDWDLIFKVHVLGAYKVTKAAYPYMRENKYGRVIMTSSAAGLYGNFGQVNYSAAKLALLGFAQALAREGKGRNIHCNTIAPIAGSRLTATVLPPDLVEALKPEYVAPLVGYLCHESCEETGATFELGAGWISRVRWQRSEGSFFPKDTSRFTPEAVAAKWDKINDFDNGEVSYPLTPNDAFGPIMANLGSDGNAANGGTAGDASASNAGNDSVKPALVLAHKFADISDSYTERDVSLYSLGVGGFELPFTFELNGDGFNALPTFGVTLIYKALGQFMDGVPGLDFNPMMLLHGEQELDILAPIPTKATITTRSRIKNLYDKGKGALLILESEHCDETNTPIFRNTTSLFIRGIGGFGGDRGPKGDNRYDAPKRQPDAVHRDQTSPHQALLYRLAGDANPLHADPAMAAMGGFDKPILHGLCTYGYAGRAVLKHFCNNDPSQFKAIGGRFTRHVFPGETIVTEMWKEGSRVIFRTSVAERDGHVLIGAVTLAAGAAGGAAGGAGGSGGKTASGFKAAAIFDQLSAHIAADSSLTSKVGVIFRFDITRDGETASWIVDVKNAPGSVTQVSGNAGPKAGCTFKLSDDDFALLFAGKLNPQQAFMKGKLKISGNMGLAQKLQVLFKQGNKAKL